MNCYIHIVCIDDDLKDLQLDDVEDINGYEKEDRRQLNYMRIAKNKILSEALLLNKDNKDIIGTFNKNVMYKLKEDLNAKKNKRNEE